MKTKLISASILVYTLLLIYASLMPFDFELGNINGNMEGFWSYWPINPRARVSGSDVVSNLTMYVPLGWMLATRLRLGRKSTAFSFAIATLWCSAISLFVELTQLNLMSRIGDASDWLLNTFSGFAGAAFGVFCGTGIWLSSVRWTRRTWKTSPVDIAVMFFMLLLAADALVPFLPTILLKQVWASIKKSKFDLSAGLAVHPWHWWLVCRALVYAVLTCMLSGWGGRTPNWKDWVRACAIAASLAFCLELGKLMIVSRFFNMANVAVAWSGCIVAVFLGAFIGRCPERYRAKIDFALAAILVYLFYLAWTPFNFVWDSSMLARVSSSAVKMLPFYHYAMGGKLNHVRLFVQSVFMMGLLVYLLRVRYGLFEKGRFKVLSAALFGSAFGFVLEGGQVFLSSRTPSMTDIYCFAIGGAIGAYVPRPPENDEREPRGKGENGDSF